MVAKKILAWSPVRDLMKSVGAQIVARDAVDVLIAYLVEKGKMITADALTITHHSKREKVTKEDIELVLKMK